LRYRERNPDALYCYGIMFPFASDRSGLLDADQLRSQEIMLYNKSNLIVRIIDDECTCFNTKKRVPYRIVVETIDLKELEKK
jgi:phosphatidylinositol 4-kinase